MLDQKKLDRLLFIDIETTSQKSQFNQLTDIQQELFKKRFKKDIESQFALKIGFLNTYCQNMSKTKANDLPLKDFNERYQKLYKQIEDDVIEEIYNIKAPIHPEWSRILCISCGVLWKQNQEDENYYMKILSFYDDDEKKLLESFLSHNKLYDILNKIPNKFDKNRDDFWALVGHNISIFDLPVLSKRIILNGMSLPKMLDVSHLKSWDLADVIIDTKQVWSYNVYDNSTSLELLCNIFNVESSKDDISGKDIKDVYFLEKNLEKIVKYCEKDVVALANVYLKMKSMKEGIKVYEKQ